MATLTPLNAAFPLDASDGTVMSFIADQSPHVRTAALDDISDPFLTMDDLSYYIEYNETGRTDDTLILSIRIVNGGTILAAADNTGTFQTVDLSVIGSETSGPIGFNYVNGTADLATWNGGIVELEQTINRSMGADGCRIQVDYVEFTGNYTPSVQVFDVVHTTDIGVGLFEEHTTDLVVSEFQAPTATSFPASASQGDKVGVDSNGTVWMVGVNGSNIRLWEGPASGPGFWQLHEIAGTGTVRDVAMAIIADRIHVVYSYHSGSTMRQWHLVWDATAESWTDNGSFGPSESHSDSTVSQRNTIGIVATTDNELVVISWLHNYVSFAGQSAYRIRARLTRSVNESFPTTGVLFREHYGDNIFDPPTTVYAPRLFTAANGSVLIEELQGNYTFFDSSGTFSETFPYAEESHSLPVMASTGHQKQTGSVEPIVHFHNNRYYRHVGPAPTASGYISGADNSDSELLYDQGELAYENPDWTNKRGSQLIIDEHGQIGFAVYAALPSPDNVTRGRLILFNGVGWYTYDWDISIGSPTDFYRARELVNGSFSAWHHNASSDWTFIGTTIPHRQVAHTADLIVSSKPVVLHTTDMLISSGMWGSPSMEVPTDNPRKNWIVYNSSHYIVTSAPQRTVESAPSVYIFTTDDPRQPGTLISTLRINDLPNASQVSHLKAWDMVHVNGVLHFIFAAWINTQIEFHHSEYDIDTDTWTHNGSFDDGPTIGHETDDPVVIAERSNGDLVALFHIDDHFGATTDDGYQYSLNTGTGFGAGVQLGLATSSFGAGIAIDGDDVHFLSYSSVNSYHYHLDPSNVLGAQQTHTRPEDDQAGWVYPTSKPLVHSGTMYIPFLILVNGEKQVWVQYAATKLDAPTWTEDTVSTKNIQNLAGFLLGLNGVPTIIYIEEVTWKIWKATLEGGTWVERDTGQKLPVDDYDRENTLSSDKPLYLSELDSDNFVYLWWWRKREHTPDLTDFGGERWYPYRVNLNPLVVHTTDVVLSPAPLKVTHTTDVIASLTSTIDHTTDLVTITGAGSTVSINHSTDIKAVDRASVAHTTDAHVAFVVDLTHTTDLHVVATPHDLSVTITLPYDLSVVLEQGFKPDATGLGVPRKGDQAPRVHRTSHRRVNR